MERIEEMSGLMSGLKIEDRSKVKYRDESKKLSSEDVVAIAEFILGHQREVLALRYVPLVLPLAYRYTCKCQTLRYSAEDGVLVIEDSFAKKASRCKATKYWVRVATDEAVASLKKDGWRLIDKEWRDLVR